MAAPVLLPKHKTLLPAVVVASAVGWVMLTVLEDVQEFASVTVTVRAPMLRLLITEVVAAVDQR